MDPSSIQTWQPLGRVVEPEPNGTWWVSHASYPTALIRKDGRLTIFFSVRDASNRSSLASIELDLDGDSFRRIGPVMGPLLSCGPRGAFDADGVTATCFVEDGPRLLAFYLGWTIGVSVPFTNLIGLAVQDSADSPFVRAGAAPIIGRSEENPFTLGYPWVIRQSVGYRMWFGSHLSWGAKGLEMEHVIKQARSMDGRNWTADQSVVVGLKGPSDPDEFAVSRPCVIVEPNGGLSMWYARRKPGYELGFAFSSDDVATFERRDNLVQISGKPEAWEDMERTYPCVFDHKGERYMLYNGNGYGRSGFGIARLRQPFS